jgi:hypothetical protein
LPEKKLISIDLTPVPDFADLDGPGGIIDRINNPVIPLPDPVAFLDRISSR